MKTYYGNIIALKGVDLEVNAGEIVAMIGANGAGKSTLMMTIFGDPRPREGHVSFEGRDITGLHAHEIARMRIAQAPEGRRIFGRMTVLENLQMGAYTRRDQAAAAKDVQKTLSLFPHLKDRMKQKAGTLSTGEQQMLAMGRALVLKPKLLLADEPSLGLSPNYLELIFDRLVEINKNGTSILLVEQNASEALEIAHRAYVFNIGEIVLEDTGKNLLSNEKVKKTFLGS